MFRNSLITLQKDKYEADGKKMREKIMLFSKDKDRKNEKKSFLPNKTITNEFIEMYDNCILNKRCPYYKKYIKIKNELKSFISSREKLKLINQSLYIAFSEKSILCKEIKEENKNLKGIIYRLTGLNFTQFLNNSNTFNTISTLSNKRNKTYNSEDNHKSNKITKKSKVKIKFNLTKRHTTNSRNNNFNSLFNSNSLNNNDMSDNNYNYNYNSKKSILKKSTAMNNSFDSFNASDINDKEDQFINNNKNNIRHDLGKAMNRVSGFVNNFNPINYYEMINEYTKMQKLKVNTKETNSSYLSLDVDLMTLLNKNSSLLALEQFTKNDEKFIKECKASSNDILFKYCDCINSLIGDYKEIIKLNTRMKDIIKGSIRLIESIISNDSSKKFIEITCDILKCDRASLFLYDKVSEKLILYTGEGVKKAQIKVDKEKGIVGACFTEARIIRIEDAYLEERFNKEIDKKTNYRTKSILCCPLINNEGDCFGVIEAINKKDSTFTEDDQELLKLLSQEASSIFKSLAYYDNNKFLVSKLYLIIDYSNKIQYINNKYEFCKITEETLLHIFSCMNSVMYFVKDDYLIRYNNENEFKKYNMNLGIIGKVIKSKEIIGYKDVKNSEEYNSLIDIKTFYGLLTFPILTKKTKNVCAVIQVPYFEEINKYGKPRENETKIVKKICKCIKNWIFRNEQSNI
jgi:putative methionine-R-sulfoxide reductase with GAF domain